MLQLKNLLGPLAAGVLTVSDGASNVLWLDAETFALSAMIVSASVLAIAIVSTSIRKPVRALFAEAADGLRYIPGERVILSMSLVSLVGNFTLIPVFLVVLPVYAAEILGDAARLGVVIAALGAGALAGSVAYGAAARRFPRRLWYIAARSGSAVGFIILSFTPGVIGAAVALASMGITSGAGRPLGATVRQERTPLPWRGRVFGAIIALNNAATPAGVLVAGLFLSKIGLQTTLICYTTISVALVAVVISLPVFHRMAPAPAM